MANQIQCPECGGDGYLPEDYQKRSPCPLCKGSGTIPDRRAPSAAERAVDRIKDAMVGVNCQHCQMFVDAVRKIINEEAARG